MTQDVYDAFSGASAPDSSTTHFFIPSQSLPADDNTTIESFDAFPQGGSTLNPGCITTKTGGPSFDRPNSSTDGIAALTDEVNGTRWENSSASCTGATVSVTGQINFARAARGPKKQAPSSPLRPFARDAVAYITTTTAIGLNSLTTAQLKSLYSGTHHHWK